MSMAYLDDISSPCMFPRLERSRMTLPATLRGQCTFPIGLFSPLRWVWRLARRSDNQHLVLLAGLE